MRDNQVCRIQYCVKVLVLVVVLVFEEAGKEKNIGSK